MERILTVELVYKDEDVVDSDGECEEGNDFGNDKCYPNANERENFPTLVETEARTRRIPNRPRANLVPTKSDEIRRFLDPLNKLVI